MFRYVLAILLVTCYNSLGNPVRLPSKQISTSILALENKCGNVFLKRLLNSKLHECSVALVDKTKQLQCLMFYDMSAQLCSAVSTSGITLNEDYTNKINEETDINSLCETTKDWIFSDLPEYQSYRNIQNMFKHPVKCGLICGSDEMFTDDANFYCKFYKWGWEVIKNQAKTVSQDITNVSAVAESQPNIATSTNKSVNSIFGGNESDISIKNSIKSLTFNDQPKETELSLDTSKKSNDSNNADIKEIVPKVTITNKEASHQITADTKNTEQTQENVKKTEKPSSIAQEMLIPSIGKVATEALNKNVSTIQLSGSGKEELKVKLEEKQSVVENHKAKVENKETVFENPNEKAEQKESVLENPKDKVEQKESVLENPKDKVLIDQEHYGDDDFNSEDGKEGNDDLQGEDDGGDPMINDNTKPLEKKTETDNKLEPIESSFNKEISPREFYSGNAQDVAADDDDHFFTFFLTAVILVVLLYILYHDKSKISKLFFGLLVEGRHSSRRRNSRGHAYRRLDTLEQAMSTNTAAPPSKIIY